MPSCLYATPFPPVNRLAEWIPAAGKQRAGSKHKEDDNFKNDLKNLLTKYSLNNSIDLLNKNYGAFEIKQKNEEPNKEEN